MASFIFASSWALVKVGEGLGLGDDDGELLVGSAPAAGDGEVLERVLMSFWF